MNLTRIIPVGPHRLGNICLTLKFDQYLPAFTNTIIISPLPNNRINSLFQKYNIDTSNFIYYQDNDIIEQYPEINNWRLTGENRGNWLVQQAFKLACIDSIDSEYFLIQDADSFCVKPYQPIIDNKLNFFHLPNVSHAPGYYRAVKNIIGYPRKTEHCFVCDIMPVKKSIWQDLKSSIESKFQKHWLDAIIDSTPWDHVRNLKWFSEYELLANWHMIKSSQYQLTQQKRYEIRNMIHLTHQTWTNDCNFVSEMNPQGQLLVFDYASDSIQNFNEIYDHLSKLVAVN